MRLDLSITRIILASAAEQAEIEAEHYAQLVDSYLS